MGQDDWLLALVPGRRLVRERTAGKSLFIRRGKLDKYLRAARAGIMFIATAWTAEQQQSVDDVDGVVASTSTTAWECSRDCDASWLQGNKVTSFAGEIWHYSRSRGFAKRGSQVIREGVSLVTVVVRCALAICSFADGQLMLRQAGSGSGLWSSLLAHLCQ